MRLTTRRTFLQGLGATVVGASTFGRSRRARADGPVAKRVLFFYFPDGIPGTSQNGEPSLWHVVSQAGGEVLPTSQFSLPSVLSPLTPHQADCVFLEGLSLGPTDNGSHPGGAKKLLTAKDGGGGWSIDHYLAQTVGAGSAHRHGYSRRHPKQDRRDLGHAPIGLSERLTEGGRPGRAAEILSPRRPERLDVHDHALHRRRCRRCRAGGRESAPALARGGARGVRGTLHSTPHGGGLCDGVRQLASGRPG